MEAAEQIKKFGEFFEENYKEKLLKSIREDKRFLVVDFHELSKFDPDLANLLLDQPEEVIKAAELAIEQLDLDGSNFRVRFTNLPESQNIMIRNIRSVHIGKLLVIEGVVRQKSDVRPQVTAAKFECPSCGNIQNILQLSSSFKEPTRCGCGRKGKFRELSKELVDAQGLVVEEAPENLEGGEQPKRINILLKEDLVSPLSERKTNPGSKISVIGVIKEVPIILRTGGKSIRFDLIIESNYVGVLEETFFEVEISEEEEASIKEIAADQKVYSKLSNSIAPSIYGYDRIKEALLLQLVGGIRKVRKDKVVSRGDMHILLVGDPGAGKCTDGDSKIILEDGEIATIKSFYEKNVSFNSTDRSTMKLFSINECGLNSASQPVRFWRRKAPKEMLKIITQTGNELVVTKEHPIFTTNNGLIFSKRTDDFKVGEYIATPSKLNVKGSLQLVNSDIKKTKAHNKKRYNCKKVLDSDFARYLGYLIGDGNVRFNQTTGVVRFTNSNNELLNDFENLTKRIFGCRVSNKRKRKNNCYDYRWFSIEVVRILEKICPNITKKSDEMSIPSPVCKSPNYVLKEFIKSLFDCEGHIRKNRREIEFSSKSKELVYDLKCVLLRFGILSQISSSLKCATNTKDKIKRTYYRLRISGEDVIKYYDEIGFVSNEKQKQLKGSIKRKTKINTNINVVPNIRGLLKVLRKKYNLSQFDFPVTRLTYQHYEKGDSFPSYNKLQSICKKYNKIDIIQSDPLLKILNQISKSDIFWDKIKGVETIEYDKGHVYDLEVENVHNFVAAGIVVHNSALLKRINIVAPKGRYVSGKGVSAAGLTASVVKDEFLKGWSLEAGAMVLSSNGICCVDELDKMSVEDTSAMHEALENQTVSISKANIQATLLARTTVLAAANPKFGRFDPFGIIADQINLPPALINRFDLIFIIKDLPDEKKDKAMAAHMLSLHQNPDIKEPEVPTKLLRKFIAYTKQKVNPKLTDGAIKEIQDYYIKMRMSGGGEGVKTIPISPRQLEALVRMSEASARIRLSDKVVKKDARKAIELLEYSLAQVGFDKETGKIDIDRIATGIPASQRSNIIVLKEIIKELESRLGKTIPIDDIIEEAKSKGIDEEKAEEVLDKLKRFGEIFEPRRGFVQSI